MDGGTEWVRPGDGDFMMRLADAAGLLDAPRCPKPTSLKLTGRPIDSRDKLRVAQVARRIRKHGEDRG